MIRHTERERAASSTPIFPEPGRRFHLFKVHGVVFNKYLAVQMENVHGDEAEVRIAELRLANTSTSYDFRIFKLEQGFVTDGHENPGSNHPFKYHVHRHPEKVDLPPID